MKNEKEIRKVWVVKIGHLATINFGWRVICIVGGLCRVEYRDRTDPKTTGGAIDLSGISSEDVYMGVSEKWNGSAVDPEVDNKHPYAILITKDGANNIMYFNSSADFWAHLSGIKYKEDFLSNTLKKELANVGFSMEKFL